MMKTYPLSHFATFIRRVFALNLPDAVWIAAELGEVSESRGHVWLTLVEKAKGEDTIVAQLDAVIWSRQLMGMRKQLAPGQLAGILQRGMSVRLKVTTSFHERYGLKLIVEEVDTEYTIGALQTRRQTTLEHLSRDGILDRNARLPLPILIQRMAVISSISAAGLSDFQRQLDENRYGYIFYHELFPAAMQGLQTAEEVNKRLRQIARRQSDFDVIVIVRGGGGKMDLAAFDDEALCRSVADAPLPVIVGIGHEVDDTVLDRVVHRSLKTPTAVAAFLIDGVLEAESTGLHFGRQIYQEANRRMTEEAFRLDNIRMRIHQSVAFSVRTSHQRAAALEETVFYNATKALEHSSVRLDDQQRLLNALRPETTLARGYALVSQDGKVVTDPSKIKTGAVDLRLREGPITLRKD